MIPVLISGCTGWVHLPPPEQRSSRGVLLCTSLGNEACILHRPLVLIADMLARGGLTVLRLDYPGSGDSVQDQDAETLPDEIIRAIAAAAEWLRREADVDEVALCGIRAGALLAGAAAPLIPGLWGLAMLAAPASGRVFMREMLMTARAWDAMWLVDETSEQNGWFEAHGVWMTLAAKKAFEALDLRRMNAAPAPRVLVIEPDTARNTNAVPEKLRGLGVEVTEAAFTDYEALLRDALENEMPKQAAEDLRTWLCAGATATPGTPYIHAAPPRRTLSGAIETTVQFGPDGTLAGVLAQPAEGPARLAALIVNTGAHPHTGHSRYSVTLSRQLARAGVATLRMDASGLGDSDPSTGHRNDVYSVQHVADARAGFQWVRERIGRPVLVIGLCSGAYSAVRMWDQPELAGLVLVNMQRLFFDPGLSLKVVQTNTKRTTQFYMSNIGKRDIWVRLISGKIDVAGISRALAGRGLRRARSAADPLLARVGIRSRYAKARSWFTDLARRRVPVGYVLSGMDPGWDELEEYFGAGGSRLRRLPNVVLHRLENADHTLSHKPARDELYTVVQQVIDRAAPSTAQAIPHRASAIAA